MTNTRHSTSATAPENFLFGKDGPVTTITFNRPERRNCMSREVMAEFERLVQRVRDDRETRVLIVTGTGAAFSAGADVSGARDVKDPDERRRIFVERNGGLARMIGRVFDQVTRLDCMTIAAVNGYAVGGGWALALAFDFTVAAEEAEFWVPEVDLSAPFTGGPAVVMAMRMGPWRAKEAAILCRHYTARELLKLGMVSRVVKARQLTKATRELADTLLKKPFKAAITTKHFLDGVFLTPRLY
ncbi:MAG TPA: enoyl-CoA hydratase/isomerase family protein [Candidatus Binataceae bacterium]|nr:enoyl-CoA hydratase/isomerase family protein [Candidatus Binataceae bacterium]